MTPIFAIHVGFSKTGTTTLQNHLFRNHSQVEYLGKPYCDPSLKAELHRLMMLDSIAYQAEVDGLSLREIVNSRFATMGKDKRVLLLSDEMFVSYTKVRDKGVIAQRIQDVLAPQKIIITIRNQKELLKSAYLSRGRLLFNVPPRFYGLHVTFEQWLSLGYDNFARGYLEHADFAKTIAYYARVYGRENVCVLLLEELIHKKAAHLQKLADFLGIDAAEALTRVQDAHEHQEISQAILDWEALNTRFFPVNTWFPVRAALTLITTVRKKIKKDAQAYVTITASWEKRLRDIYRAGNQQLVHEYGLPLEQYDYPL